MRPGRLKFRRGCFRKFPAGLFIVIKNLSRPCGIAFPVLRFFVKEALRQEGIAASDLCVVFVDSRCMRRLKKKYSGRDSETDVLSFDLRPAARPEASLKGDIVICVDRALAEARARRLPFKEELLRYILHGILHLTGYDDRTTGKKRKMWKRQEFLLKKYLKTEG